MLLIILSNKGFEDNLSAHTFFIQESENRQEDCGLELINTVRMEKWGIWATRGNSKTFSLKLNKIDIYYVMILLVRVCYDYGAVREGHFWSFWPF